MGCSAMEVGEIDSQGVPGVANNVVLCSGAGVMSGAGDEVAPSPRVGVMPGKLQATNSANVAIAANISSRRTGIPPYGAEKINARPSLVASQSWSSKM